MYFTDNMWKTGRDGGEEFLSTVAKYIWLHDYKTIEEILELHVYNLKEIISDYKQELIHLLKMKYIRISNHSDSQKKRS